MTRWTWRAWPLPWPGAGGVLAYTRRVYPISALRGVWMRHGVAARDGTRLILAIDRGALGVRLWIDTALESAADWDGDGSAEP